MKYFFMTRYITYSEMEEFSPQKYVDSGRYEHDRKYFIKRKLYTEQPQEIIDKFYEECEEIFKENLNE